MMSWRVAFMLLWTTFLEDALGDKKTSSKCNSDSWESLPTSLSPSRRASAVLENECEILLFGGLNGSPPDIVATVTSLNTLEEDPEWTELGEVASDMEQPWFPTTKGALIINNKIYVTCEDAADGKIWQYSRDSNTFTLINDENRMPFPSEDCCAFGINDEIYIFGGQNSGTSFGYVQIYNIKDDEWRLGSEMYIAREDMACSVVDNEIVYLFGGQQGDEILDSVEKYYVATDSWQFFDEALNPARRSFPAAYIPNTNEILLVAGTC